MKAVEAWRSGGQSASAQSSSNGQSSVVIATGTESVFTGKQLAARLAKELDEQQELVYQELQRKKEAAAKQLLEKQHQSQQLAHVSQSIGTNIDDEDDCDDEAQRIESDFPVRVEDKSAVLNDSDLSESPSIAGDAEDDGDLCLTSFQSHVEFELVESTLGVAADTVVPSNYYVVEEEDD